MFFMRKPLVFAGAKRLCLLFLLESTNAFGNALHSVLGLRKSPRFVAF